MKNPYLLVKNQYLCTGLASLLICCSLIFGETVTTVAPSVKTPAAVTTPPALKTPPAKVTLTWESKPGDNLNPESAYPHEKFIYVSNVGKGDSEQPDQDGYINKYGLDGKLLSHKWVQRLNDPKGMRAKGGVLWVSDRNELVAINIAVGAIRSKYKIKDALFLNDIAIADSGAVFVSDTLGSAIYQLHEGKLDVFVKGPEWESPNGLLIVDDQLIVAAWGLVKSFNDTASGSLYSISLKTKEKKLLSDKPLGNLDGLETLSPNLFLLSDWAAGTVFTWDSEKKVKDLLLEGFKGSADLGYNSSRGEIFVPRMGENLLSVYRLVNVKG